MSDVFEDVVSGEPLTLKAETINGWNKAARTVLRPGSGFGSARDLDDGRRPEVIRIKNKTGYALEPAACLALGTPATTPALNDAVFRSTINFEGGTPASATDLFAITIDPIRVDGVGLALVCGAAFVSINVSDASHQFATPSPGYHTVMQSAQAGPARILWKESGTGICKAYVLLNGQGQSPGRYTWTETQTGTIAASWWQAIIAAPDAEITLPLLSTGNVNDRIAVLVLSDPTAMAQVAVYTSETGGTYDKINGLTNFSGFHRLVNDNDWNTSLGGTGSGGLFEFIKTGNSDCGWACPKWLQNT